VAPPGRGRSCVIALHQAQLGSTLPVLTDLLDLGLLPERRHRLAATVGRAAAYALLQSTFDFYDEVEAISAEGDSFRIDAVCRCATSGYVFGWEFKRSHLFKKEFAAAMRQAIHYRLARITDERLPELAGAQLLAVAVFPDWLGEHDEAHIDYRREADGMRLLASHFRVGTMRWSGQDRLSFIMGESAIWHSDRGWSPNAEGVLHGKRRLGATKRKDR
jgi:hypothetical protein